MLAVYAVYAMYIIKRNLRCSVRVHSSGNTQTQNIFKILVLVLKTVLNFVCLIFMQYLLFARIKFCKFFKIAKIAKI